MWLNPHDKSQNDFIYKKLCQSIEQQSVSVTGLR